LCCRGCAKQARFSSDALGCAARLFLRKLRSHLKIPVLALVDSDPYGLKILSVYMKVSVPCAERDLSLVS